MKLEQQVTSIQISKKLEELGVKQESLFYWIKDNRYRLDNTDFELSFGTPKGAYSNDKKKIESENWLDGEIFSAFTVAELGEMLQEWKNLRLDSTKDSNGWSIAKNETDRIYADTEADARGKMLIYLLEHNLIKNDKLNK